MPRCAGCGDYTPDDMPCDACMYQDADEDGGDGLCSRCGGDGFVECPRPLECTRVHTEAGQCACGACGGTGNARDQTIW